MKPENDLALGLFDGPQGKSRPVEFALKSSSPDAEGHYRLAGWTVAPR